MSGLSVLAIPANPFPTRQPVLEEIFARRLGRHGADVTWVARPRDARAIGPQDVPWHVSRVLQVAGASSPRLAQLRQLLLAWTTARQRAPDVWFVRNLPSAAALGLVLRRWVGCRVVYQVSFPYDEAQQALAKTWLQSARARLRLAFRNAVARRVDLVVPISDLMGARFVAAGVAPERIWPLGMGANVLQQTPPTELAHLRAELGLEGKRVIIYFGTIAPLRQLDVLVRSMAVVAAEAPEAALLLLGDVKPTYRADLEQLARSLNLDDSVRFHGPVPREQVTAHLELAELSVALIPPEDMYVVSFPTKTVESLACGVPVVGTDIPAQRDLIERSGGGVVVEHDADAIGRGILSLLRAPERARAMGRAGRAFVTAHLDYDLLARRVATKLGEVADRPVASETCYSPEFVERVIALHHGKEGCPNYDGYIAAHLGGPNSRLAGFRRRLVPEIERRCGPLTGKRVLDVGSGTGASTAALAERGADVVAFDVDARSMEICRLRLREQGLADRVRSVLAPDLGVVADELGAFDLVVLNGVIEHVPLSIDGLRGRLLRTAFDLLRPGGHMVINETPNRLWPKDVHTTGLWWIPWSPSGSRWAFRRAVAAGKHVESAVGHSPGPRGLEERGAWGATVPEIFGYLAGRSFRCLNLGPGQDRHLSVTDPGSWRRRAAERVVYTALTRWRVAPITAVWPMISNLVIERLA